MGRQRQHAGDESTNVQAGGDVTIHAGLSVAEVRQVALDVFHSNFLELAGIAADVARGRAEALVESFLEELQRRSPDSLQRAADPDMQRALFDAQREFACSGEEDLEQVLVDLLVDRAEQPGRGLQAIVLNEAINSAPKLTMQQRKAVAASFVFKYTRWTAAADLDGYYEQHVRFRLSPLMTGLPRNNAAYQHIEYVGAGAVGLGTLGLADAVSKGARRWFTRGFTREEVPEQLLPYLDDETGLFIPCLRDEARLQLNIFSEDDIPKLVGHLGNAELRGPLTQLLAAGAMPGDEIRAELTNRVPESAELFDVWENSPLKNLTLTSVGLALGHGYWRRLTGTAAPLRIWIPET